MIVTSEFADAPWAQALVNVKKEERAASSSHAPESVEGSLPTQPAFSVDSLAVAYVIVLHSLAETLFEHTAPARSDADSGATARRRREVCAAVWATNRVALGASTLSIEERAIMKKAIWQRLLLYWKDFCGSNGDMSEWIEKRATEYMQNRLHTGSVATASHIVEVLLDAIPIAEPARSAQLRALSGLVGHRIVSDVTHFDELKSRYRFV